MTYGRLVALALAAVVLVGAGVWLGRSTRAATPDRATREATTPAAAAHTKVAPADRDALRPMTPVLPPRSAAASSGLAADLADADPRVRAAAVAEVATSPGPDPAVLLAASRDTDINVAGRAMDAVAKLYAQGAIPVETMVERATDRALNDRVRVVAINGLGVVRSDEAGKTLVAMLANGTPLERRAASVLLVHQDPEVAVPALIAAVGDADDSVRWGVRESLRKHARGRDFGDDAAAWRAWWQSRR